MGDLNETASLDEREGSNSDCIDQTIQFRERWDRCNLLDAGWFEIKFTWTRCAHGQVVLQERLDGVLHNTDFMELFPNLQTTNLPRFHSNHNLIMVNTNVNLPMEKDKRPFRFEVMWLTHPGFNTVFHNAWEKKKTIMDGVTETEKDVKIWKETAFDDIFKNKRTLQNRIKGIQKSPKYIHSRRLQEMEDCLNEELQQCLIRTKSLVKKV
ncbi:uncharacterized protein LOC120210232 [Hibiscus syriacus]|nr:uncharacterized protein LOC120210232 [Hibiscus syriacus]